MKIGIGLCALLLAICGTGHAQVNALPQSRHILVYGEAQAQAIPDRFRITLSFNVVDSNADAARQKVEAYLQDAISKLKASGIGDGGIVATSLEIEPVNQYDQEARKQVFEGIGVTRRIVATFARQDALKSLLALLKTSEDVQVSGVETELSTEPRLRERLRQKAIESTRAKAETIARAYGVRLAGLYSVSDTAPDFQYGIKEGEWPQSYRWNADSTELDRIEVTGSRIKRSDVESFQTGYVTFDDKIYAVFLISE